MAARKAPGPGSDLYAQETRLRLEALEAEFRRYTASQAADWDKLMKTLEQLKQDVEHAKHGRPTWTVTWIITTLASLCTGLFMRLVG